MTILGSPLRRASAAALVLLLFTAAAACSSSSDSSAKTDTGPSSGQLDTAINGANDSSTIPAGSTVVTFTPTATGASADLDALATAIKDRVRALGLQDVVVQVKGDTVVANVPKGVAKADVVALGDAHALLFRPALQSFPGGPNDDLTDPKCDAPTASTDKPCLAVDTQDSAAVLLGPATVDGTVVDNATVSPSTSTDSGSAGTYQVAVVAKSDKKADLNAVANKCNAGDATCPASGGANGRLAVVLDGTVVVIPTVTTKDVADNALVITGDFTKQQADELAKQIKLASVPLPTAVTAS